jgi:hypothetical protein
VNPITGRILWRFRTYNPQLRNDPDGGGEVVNSPVIGPNGTVYFGTWGFGPYETNAFYAVNPDSALQWRFPADSSLTGRPIFASPAISPDQSTIYFGTFLPDGGSTLVPKLYALNLQPSGAIPDHARVKWELELRNVLFPVYVTTLAVGSDGTIYAGGYYPFLLSSVPVIFAIEEVQTLQGIQPRFKWAKPYVELREGAQVGQFVGGESDPNKVYEPGEIPPNTTCKFYTLKPLTTSVNDRATTPIGFRLELNYPNPANPETVLEYQLSQAMEVEISIFNLHGQKVVTLVKEHRTAGSHKISWNGTDAFGRLVASGVYLYQLKAGDPSTSSGQSFVAVRKMLVLR